jgi:hypothetical protein
VSFTTSSGSRLQGDIITSQFSYKAIQLQVQKAPFVFSFVFSATSTTVVFQKNSRQVLILLLLLVLLDGLPDSEERGDGSHGCGKAVARRAVCMSSVSLQGCCRRGHFDKNVSGRICTRRTSIRNESITRFCINSQPGGEKKVQTRIKKKLISLRKIRRARREGVKKDDSVTC